MSTTTPGAAAIAVQARSPLSTVDRRAPPDAAATTLVCDLSRRARRAPTATGDAPLERIVVFLPRRSADVDRDAVERCMRLAAEHSQCRICLVGTFRVHFGDLQPQGLKRRCATSFGGSRRGELACYGPVT